MMMPFRPGLNFGPVGTIEEDLYQVWPFQIKERLIQLGEILFLHYQSLHELKI